MLIKDERKFHSGEKSGKEKFSKTYKTRHKAYFMEQALLKATNEFASCPNHLWEEQWIGVTEARNLEVKALKFLAEELDKELAEQGIWKFAIKYVSMTEH